MEYVIFYPTAPEELDPKNDNVDVCVRFADGREYNFVFATPRNLYRLMKADGTPYWYPGLPFLFVEELTRENIEACIAAIAEDRGLLILYGRDVVKLLETK